MAELQLLSRPPVDQKDLACGAPIAWDHHQNFWLATHVIAITIGDAATFLAGFLGIAFLIPRASNLYSSSLFVAWVAVGLGLLAERFTRDGIVTAVASALGFASLLIAHHLVGEGDTMGVLIAVLDSKSPVFADYYLIVENS